MMQLYDLVIVGSGPAALAVLARILERRPAALYTEDEREHLHWLHRQEQRVLRLKQTGRGSEKMLVGDIQRNDNGEADRAPLRILVIDRFGGWLANWNRLFAAYGITHLRSPLFFHVAPHDNDALCAFAERQASSTSEGDTRVRQRRSVRKQAAVEREAAIDATQTQRVPDLLEVAGCVGKEIPKHKRKHATAAMTQRLTPAVNERDRRDYFTPSAALFKRFVEQDIVQRYGLQATSDDKASWPLMSSALTSAHGITLARGNVCDLSWQTQMHVQGHGQMDGFRVHVSDGGEESQMTLAAKAVVLAVGPGVCIGLPKCLQSAPSASSPSKPSPRQGPGWCHSTQLGLHGQTLCGTLSAARPSPRQSVLAVIGGGLSAAQICDLALRTCGVSHVHLLMRSHVKSKPFDVGLEWIGRFGNLEKMCFWQEEEAQARLDKLRAARQGGSITPRYVKLLRQYEQQGRLTIHTCTEVAQASWAPSDDGVHEDDGTWSLQLQKTPNAVNARARRQTRRASGSSGSEGDDGDDDVKDILTAHYLVAATGAAPSFSDVPFLRLIVEQPQYRVSEYGGLPFLTEDLQYGSLPLFCTGAFSALQIGPAAFNLEGMRAAADRIVVRLHELALRDGEQHDDDDGMPVGHDAASPSSVSRYTYFAYQYLPRDVEA